MGFTPNQVKAITKRDSNIMVSAGAGAGKTAVLSERVKEYIKDGYDIKRFLILTFTEKAAAEMKERIRSKLKNEGLVDAATNIDEAYITTFDAYSLDMVKKYYYLNNLRSDIKIINKSILSVKRDELLDEIFLSYYKEENKRFYSLLDKFTTKDDNELKEIIIHFYESINLLVSKEDFFNNYLDDFYTKDKINFYIESYISLLNNKLFDIKNNLLHLSNILDDKNQKKFDEFMNNYFMFNKDLSYDDIKMIFNDDFKYPTLTAGASDEAKDLKNYIKKELDDLIILLRYNNISEMEDEILLMQEDVSFIIEILYKLDNNLYLFKHDMNSYTFSDVERFLISLIKNNENIKEEIKNQYDCILVDEYQDTSDMQEAFLSLISNNNLYMVGDIKQSIYRFRNANPYIFKEKYNNYQKGLDGIKIDLNANFRSRSEVLGDINQLFSNLMTSSLGDASYKEEHTLEFGNKEYDKHKFFNYNTDILSYSNDSKETGIKDNVLEAFIMASKIKELIDNKYQIYDTNSPNFSRDIKYSDIAILISSSSDFMLVKDILEYNNIPSIIEGNLDLNDSLLPKLFSNIINVIWFLKTNPNDAMSYKIYYHSMAALEKSFLFSYDDNIIYDSIKNGLNTKFNDIFYEISNTNYSNYKELFNIICSKLDIYNKLSLIGNNNQEVIVLKEIYNIFSSLDDASYNFLALKDYFNNLSELKLEYKLEKKASDNVRIMTIHASKGLEFSICFFPFLDKAFNMSDENRKYGFDLAFGAYIPILKDNILSNTIIKELVKEDIYKKDISEKVRLLYVALTRAKEKIFLLRNQSEKISMDYKSFYDMIFKNSNFNNIDIDINNISYDESYNKVLKTVNKPKGKDIISYKEYIPKYEVVSKIHVSKELTKIPTKEVLSNLDSGNLIHYIFENIDFINPNFDIVPNEYLTIVKNILSNDLFIKIKDGTPYKEYPFTFIDSDLNSYNGIIDLFVEYDTYIDLIDYKLFNLDKDEYINQLTIYKKYLKSISNKDINCYLVSLVKNEIKMLDI